MREHHVVPAGTALTPLSQVAADGDAVYVDGGDSHLYAPNAADGRVR